MGIGSWAGLWFALSIPAILLMYLLKRKFIDTTVPSHLLWDRVLKNIEANRPWQKLQNRLLLWLQLLAAALLVFALLQPYLWVSGNSGGHIVFVADTSGSMGAIAAPPVGNAEQSSQDPQETRIERMKSEMKQYVKKHARGSEVTLLSMKSEPDVIISREKDAKRIQDAIDGLTPYYGQAAYNETLSLASALTREEQNAEVVLFTDGEWKGASDQVTFDVPAHTVLVGNGPVKNAGIQQFGIQQGKEGNDAVAVLGSSGTWDAPVDVRIYGDNKLLRTESADLTRHSATLVLQSLPPADVYRIELDGDDGYAADNAAYAFGKSSREPSILLLTPGNLFLEKALQLTGAQVTRMTTEETASSNSVKTADSGNAASVPQVPKDPPDLIVVDGQAPAFTKEGSWKQLLEETPLWSIGGSGPEVKVNGQEPKVSDHPVNRYITLKGLYVGELHKEPLPAWAEPLVTIGGTPAIYAGKEAGHPRLSFLFRLQDTDLPLSAEFPILVHNAVSWLNEGEGMGLGRVTAGSGMEVPIAADAEQAEWKVQHTGVPGAGAPVPEVQKRERAISSLQTAPQVPGLYAFEERNSQGNTTSYLVEAAADPFEGTFASSKPVVLKSGQDDTGRAEAGAGEQAGNPGTDGKIGQSRYSLMWLAAAVVLLMIVTEWGVYQRGRSI
ncbi:hypothetical protein ABID47_005973 [Paenibacillus favisporus]|uniref:VWA domain-containing protein n=1 Tax=Paenibacillus favisporus TaxID=221028 RepID=A0ABV2FC60_9BACL